MSGYVRRATHAGTWYSSDPRALARQVGGWFADVRGGPNPGLSAVIGPHAGYTYCGRVLAHAYKHLDPAVVCVRDGGGVWTQEAGHEGGEVGGGSGGRGGGVGGRAGSGLEAPRGDSNGREGDEGRWGCKGERWR